MALVSGQRPKVKKGDWPWLALAGLFQTSFYFALQYAGIGLTSASNTAVIVNTRPIFVVLLSVLILREPLTSRRLGGILVAFVGVAFITTKGSLDGLGLQRDELWGDLLIILNAVSGAIGMILVKRALGKYSPFHTLVLTGTFGALGLLPFAAVEVARRGGMPAAPLAPWLVLAYQALFCSVVPHIMWNNVLARIDASRAAIFFYVTPIVAVLLSAVFLNETISIYFAVGALLVMGGAYLTMSARNKNGELAEAK